MAKSSKNMAKYATWPPVLSEGAERSGRLAATFLYSTRDYHLKIPQFSHKVPPHKHSSWQADLMREGSAVFVDASGAELVIGPGDTILIPPERPHSFLYRRSGARWMTFWFSLKGLDPEMEPLRLEASPFSNAVFSALELLLLMPEGSPRSNAIGSALSALLEASLPAREGWSEEIPPGLAGQAMLWIRRSEGRRLDVKEVCQALRCSPSHLSHAFKAQFGCSLKSFIDESRAKMIERLVSQAELSPAQLAESLGFRDSCELSRFCKRKLGASPRALRREK